MKKLKRKRAPRKRLKNGGEALEPHRREVERLERALRQAGPDLKLQGQLDRARVRAATVALMRFENLLKAKLTKITLQSGYLYKVVLQRRNMMVLSEAHRDAALRAYEEAREALARAFNIALTAQQRGDFHPTPLKFEKAGDARPRAN